MPSETTTGVYSKTIYPEGRKRGAPVTIQYRNHEIDCPACKQHIGTQSISLVRAKFGVKVACKLCGHSFIYRHETDESKS